MLEMHLQICNQEWVLWGRGPRLPHQPRFACSISPAVVHVQLPGRADPIPLYHRPPCKSAVEYERVHMWGWRWRSQSSVNSTRWRLAGSREACLEQARFEAAHQLECDPAYGRTLQRALGDVREYEAGLV